MKYRTIYFLVLFLALTCTAAAAPSKPVISADTTYYDFDSGQYVLKGNVSVGVSNRLIKAGQARVSVGSLEVLGTGGITVTQDDIYFSGDSVYVYGLQDRAEIAGNICFRRTDLTITADQAEFNWKTKQSVFSGHVTVSRGEDTWSADTVTYNLATNTFQ